jgi:hypothetical protein
MAARRKTAARRRHRAFIGFIPNVPGSNKRVDSVLHYDDIADKPGIPLNRLRHLLGEPIHLALHELPVEALAAHQQIRRAVLHDLAGL